MSELTGYQQAVHQVIEHIPADDPELAQCKDYGESSFLGASNAYVCSLMGKTEAAIAMRDGLHKEFMETGKDDWASHWKYVKQTWDKPGGGWPLVALIIENGMTAPSPVAPELEYMVKP